MTKFVTTNTGNSAVTSALTPLGLPVRITHFKVGTDYSTPATSLDTDLIGSALYTGTPTSYGFLDEDTIIIRLEIPATEGPFEFGEVGLFTDTNDLFARCSFGSPQSKFTAAISGMPNIWRFNAILRFSQAPAIFSILTNSMNRIFEAAHFGLIAGPSAMIGGPNAAIIHEPTPTGDSIFIFEHSPSRWSISNYTLVETIVLSAASSGTTVPSNDWTDYSNAANGTFLVQTLSGEIRSVASIAGASAELTQPLTPLVAGSTLDLYRINDGRSTTTLVPTIQYNRLAALFNQQWGTPTGTTPTTAKGWGQTAVPILALGVEPTPAEWNVLTSAVYDASALLGLPDSVDYSTVASDWSTDYWGQQMAYTALVSNLNSIASSKPGEVLDDNLEVQVLDSSTRSTSWPGTTRYDLTATFASQAEMHAFFNSGGWLGFNGTISPDNYVQKVQQSVMESLGNIRLKAVCSDSSGALRIRYDRGDGVVVAGGNSGFWGLTGTPRVVWNHSIVSASGTGAFLYEGLIHFYVEAEVSGLNTVDISFVVRDDSIGEFSNDTDGGTPLFQIDFCAGRANPAILSSPSIAFPAATVKASTNW